MKLTMPALPYDYDAHEPVISERPLELHYTGHLKGYVDKLNRLPGVVSSDKKKLEELIIEGKKEKAKNPLNISNNLRCKSC